MKKYYNIHNLVEITINSYVSKWIIRDIEFQVGFFLVSEPSKTKISKIEVYPYAEFFKFRNHNEPESIFYKETCSIGKYLNNENENLCIYKNDGNFIIFADYSNFLINLFIQILIVEQGYTMIHAAGYKSSNDTIHIIAGAGGIGKTSIASYAAINKGLKILGDDILIIGNNKECLAFPREFVLKIYHIKSHKQILESRNISLLNFYKIKRFIIENLPFKALIKKIFKKFKIYYFVTRIVNTVPHLATIPANKMFGENSLEIKGNIGKIFFLDRIMNSSFSINSTSSEILSNRLLSIIHHEWISYMPQFLSMGANNIINLNEYMSKISRIFSNSLIGLNLFQMNIPRKANQDDLINFCNKENIF